MRREYEINPMGHKWAQEDGQVDIFAYYEGNIHNGPQCVNCGYGFCHHCQSMPEHECTKPVRTKRKGKRANANS